MANVPQLVIVILVSSEACMSETQFDLRVAGFQLCKLSSYKFYTSQIQKLTFNHQ